MGKGGYIGGGTIIGPHTPEWFGNGGPEEPRLEPQTQPTAPTSPVFPPPGNGKTSRNQRRKRAMVMREARQQPHPPKPMLAKPKRELSAADERRIAKLRLHIKGLEQLRDGYQKQINSSLAELNGMLKEYGLPLERSGQK